ncbi:MAG: hypothetical protein SFV24_16960 [Gemmatimonadales bacterium]|nr:hypothetical protein [Gemmatimonadales bacterium]
MAFDVETDTGPAQRLLFGHYQLGPWRKAEADGVWRVQVTEEGWFYADDLPTRDPAAYQTIRDHYEASRGALPLDQRDRFHLYSRRQFIERVFLPVADEASALVTGFNLPFDLSHIAERWSRTRSRAPNSPMAGGFSLELLRKRDGSKHGTKPRVKIKHQDRTKAVIQFDRGFRGYFLDLKTLAKALTDTNHSLKSAGKAFKARVLKGDLDAHGLVSPESLDYNRRDVEATVALLEAMRAQYDRHTIRVPVARIRSPASIAKAYLADMGITSPLSRFVGSPADLGAAFAAFHGGRVEANIRGVVVPVRACDFTSMYPMMFTLTEQQAYLTAKTIDTADGATFARRVLRGVTQAALLQRETWPPLRFIALVQPTGDLLPVRAKYAGRIHGYSTGLNPLTSQEPVWVTGYDLALSVLRTGRQPTILRAIRLVTRGMLPDLQPVVFRGAVTIHPRQPILEQFVAQRQRAKSDHTLSTEEREWLPAQLKVTANIIAFGVFAETNPQTRSPADQVRVPVFGAGAMFTADTMHPEEPGPFCFPFIASFVTGAARLMLGLAEYLVTERGGSVLAKDTDSLHMVSAKRRCLVACPGGHRRLKDGRAAIVAISWAEVNAIANQLQQLMPFQSPITSRVLKVEDVNVDPRTGTPIALWGLALAAKRYCLFERVADTIRFRRRLEHGLALYRPPVAPPPTPADDPYPEDRGWIAEVWRRLVHQALTRRPGPVPPWFGHPALTQLAITSPRDLEALERVASPLVTRPYAEAIKPFNFMQAGQLAEGEVPPAGCDAKRFRAIAEFSGPAGDWRQLHWVDSYSGTPLAVSSRDSGGTGVAVRLKTIGEIVRDYQRHPEAKSLGPDGRPCRTNTRGLLSPRPVVAEELLALGKDTHRFDAVQHGEEVDWDDVQFAYPRPISVTDGDAVRRFLRTVDTDAAIAAFAVRAGVSARTIYRLKAGTGVARRTWEAARTLVDVLQRAARR